MEYKKADFDFSEYGAFFAFGQEQFDKHKKEGVKYVSAGAGLFLQKDNWQEVIELFKEHERQERNRRKEVIGKNKIIDYELNNYECFYSGDISRAVAALEGYGYTEKEVLERYNAIKKRELARL